MRAIRSRPYAVAFALVLLGLLVGCSTDTPTAPPTSGAPSPGSLGGPGVTWNVTVTVSPRRIEQNSPLPATVTVTARRADNNAPAPSGSRVAVFTNLGEFLTAGSGVQAVEAELVGGGVQLPFFPGAFTGTATITAQLLSSVGAEPIASGQATITIEEAFVEVIADFTTVNTDNNRSVQFFNLSTGDPTSFRWSFGDGATSREENPLHVYAEGGDYLVTLTASKRGSSSTITKPLTIARDPEVGLFITAVSPNTGTPEGGTAVTITGTGFETPLRVLFGGKLGTVTASSATSITVTSPPADMNTVACTTGGGDPGTRFVDTSVSLVVELGVGGSTSAPGGFTYLVSDHSDFGAGYEDCT